MWTLMRRVSGPSRKATPSLICLVEALRLDLASPAYLCPSRVPLWSPFMISSQNTFSYLTTHPRITAESLHLHCVYPVSTLHLPCIYTASTLHLTLHPASLSHHSCVPRHPAFSCVLLCSPASPCVCVLHLLQSLRPQNVPLVPWTGMSQFPFLRLSSFVFRSSAPVP